MLLRTATLLLLCLGLSGCGRETSPEEELRAVVAAAEEAAEARDASALFELIAVDYRDGHGNGIEEIQRYLRGYLIAHQSIHLLVRIDEVELLATDLARLRATVGMLGQERDGAAAWDLAADVYEFDLTLARENSDWQVTRADWRRGGLAD
jgi:ketosteroid isomerase-like protein